MFHKRGTSYVCVRWNTVWSQCNSSENDKSSGDALLDWWMQTWQGDAVDMEASMGRMCHVIGELLPDQW